MTGDVVLVLTPAQCGALATAVALAVAQMPDEDVPDLADALAVIKEACGLAPVSYADDVRELRRLLGELAS